MKAMILAAGLGTRLRPLTSDKPKALVSVAGRAMLEIALARLCAAGVTEVIVNAHHFADQIEAFLKGREEHGVRVEISREAELLSTGGGLKHAAWFFLEDGPDGDAPFIVHNVDVISNIDFKKMLDAHTRANALATLAVQDRQTSRYLLFDGSLQLCGRQAGRDGQPELVRPAKNPEPLAFSGIHIISPRLIPMITEQGAFSIIDSYLRLAAQGEKIMAFRADEYYWRDLGRPEHVAQAAQDFAQNRI